jgi:hypothetical protein
MLNVIFSANYEINPYMKDVSAFHEELTKHVTLQMTTNRKNTLVVHTWQRIVNSIADRYNNFLCRMMIGK